MSARCTAIDDLLLDGSPSAMEAAARHAESCEMCRQTLTEWNEISSTARSMQTTWHSDVLWPRIARALSDERTRSRRRITHRVWKVAAALALTISLGATMIYALRLQTRQAAFDHDILRISALDAVERAQRAHVEAIEQLERVAEARLEEDPSPLMVSYREKLMLLDDAIAECEENIERNRQNAHLRTQLLAMYSEKQQTLEQVLREEKNVQTP